MGPIEDLAETFGTKMAELSRIVTAFEQAGHVARSSDENIATASRYLHLVAHFIIADKKISSGESQLIQRMAGVTADRVEPLLAVWRTQDPGFFTTLPAFLPALIRL